MPVATETQARKTFDDKNTRPFTSQDWVLPQAERKASSVTFPYRPNTGLPQVSNMTDLIVGSSDSSLLAHVTPAVERTIASTLRQERQPYPEAGGTAAWIDFFDNNWQQAKLPQEWYNLETKESKKVGFVLEDQMAKLANPYKIDALHDWVQKTKQDLLGFKLEFLSDKVIYPRRYIWNAKDPSRLEDPLYGKAEDGVNHADIVEIISPNERNGSVQKAVGEVKEFFKNAPDGSIAVMTSPLGPTGFKTKNDLSLDYPDSYFFMQVKNGNEVMNYTLKTNFKLPQCRDAIFKLTGIRLPINASLEDYMTSLALIKPGENSKIKSIGDVVNILSEIQPEHAFIDDNNGNQVTTWQDVHEQIKEGESLYEFDKKTHESIDEFVDFGQLGTNSKEILHKGIAATILRMSKIFSQEIEVAKIEKAMKDGTWYVKGSDGASLVPDSSFGDVLEFAAARRGCTGSRQATIIKTMGGSRIVIGAASMLTAAGEDGAGGLQFKCEKGHSNTRNPGEIKSVCSHIDCESALC